VRNRFAKLFGAATVSVALTLSMSAASAVTPRIEGSSISVGRVSPTVFDQSTFGSTLTLTKNGKTSVTKGMDRVVTAHWVSKTPHAAGPTGASLHCNTVYNFSDTNNRFTIQHKCGSTTAPWVITLSAALCGIVTSPVFEAGMSWTRNGTVQPKQSNHTQGCLYYFHGTFNPDHDYDHLTYSDTFTFTALGGGRGSLNVYGDFTITGSPCSPTSC